MALFVLRGQLRKISPPLDLSTSKVEVLSTVTEHQTDGLCFLRTSSNIGLSSEFYSMSGGAYRMSSEASTMSSGAYTMSRSDFLVPGPDWE